MNKESPCEGCIFWKRLSGAGYEDTPHFCAYCYYTGHSRPYEPGKDCIVRKGKDHDSN